MRRAARANPRGQDTQPSHGAYDAAGEGFPEADGSYETGPRSLSKGPARPPVSGWLVGILFGVLIGIWSFPPVRYTLGSQLQFALASDGAPWTYPLDTRRTARQIALLDSVAAASPQDYLLQVGRATALTDARGVRSATDPSNRQSRKNDSALVRLTILASSFPGDPGACAHLARYMMLDRVRLQRAELAPPLTSAIEAPRTLPAGHRDLRLIEWALRRGEHLDPGNAFWPAMLATAYFAAARDRDGLRELNRVIQTSRWDAYIYEEVLGQWRLYSLAYGDHGAAQKIEPLSLIVFPHLREMRHMADLARWLADRDAAKGHVFAALRTRHDLARLGQIMRDTAPWSYEALYGTEILLIASTDGGNTQTHGAILNTDDWRAQAPHLIELLTRSQHLSELEWITQQVQTSCSLRRTVDSARSDASFPGIPPGIPLAALFGEWMTGVCLIQQSLALMAAVVLTALCARLRSNRSRRVRTATIAFAILALGCGALFFLGLSSSGIALACLVGTTLLMLLALSGRSAQKGVAEAEAEWNSGTTARLLLLVLPAGLLALHLAQPILARLHPVAVLLTSLMNVVNQSTGWDAARNALLAGALPLCLVLAAGLWGAARGISALAAAQVGLRRMALPTLACLAIVYLLLMQSTLQLDSQASQAIGEAARNDRQWVLTHVESGD